MERSGPRPLPQSTTWPFALAAMLVPALVLATACVVPGPGPGTTTTTSAPTTSTSTTSTTAPPPNLYDAACAGPLSAGVAGTVESSALTEISGVVASRANAGVLWVHNDSGDTARVFAMSTTGQHLGYFNLTGASAVDWEDIAIGPGPTAGVTYLYLADIGDNGSVRPSVQVYRVPEPVVSTASPPGDSVPLAGVDRLNFVYPDGAHNAEALLVDPTSGEMVIVTKDFSGTSQIFQAPAGLVAGSTTTLTATGSVTVGSGIVTGGDVSPAGDVIAIRTYGEVVLYDRPAGTALTDAFAGAACADPGTVEAQGEAVGFAPDGASYVTLSEGGHPPINRFSA